MEGQKGVMSAQTPASGEAATPLTVKEITVTSTKTARDPITTPGEVNIITREEIERTQALSLKDVLKYQPGVEEDFRARACCWAR